MVAVRLDEHKPLEGRELGQGDRGEVLTDRMGGIQRVLWGGPGEIREMRGIEQMDVRVDYWGLLVHHFQ